MRKYLLIACFLLIPRFGHAAIVSINTPTSVTQTGTALSSSTLSAQTGGLQNCINAASLMSTTVSNMSIIDGTLATGTTIWQVINAPANVVVYPVMLPVNPIILGSGEINALCGGGNSPLVVQISSGTKSINFQSFIRK